MSDKKQVLQVGKQKEFKLKERLERTEGRTVLSGIQALVRLPIDQMRADRRAGMRTAAFISGYRGSPLGGLDIQLARGQDILQEYDVIFMPGVNEDLAATAVYGSQIANLLPDPKYEGVAGYWYGKAPGVDRSGDVFKHVNMVGTGRKGGVLVIAGDDPNSKSSTLPSASETALFDAMMPVLYPGSIEEILFFGRMGIELSRFSGLWVGMKVVTDVADGYASVDIVDIDVKIPDGEAHVQEPTLLPHNSRRLERDLYQKRLTAVKLFVRENRLNRIVHRGGRDRRGIIAAGKTYYDLMEALEILGLDGHRIEELGLRVLKLGVIFPVEDEILREFVEGLEEVLVIEEKRGFIEMQVKSILFNMRDRPTIIGKMDREGEMLVKPHGEILVGDIIEVLGRYLGDQISDHFSSRRNGLSVIRLQTVSRETMRTPYFCSGCPHNRSTLVPEGSLSGAGIGCHGLSLSMSEETIGLLHMGGEGIPWVGASQFSGMEHMFQNIGDGTLAHSGHLAIRQAIASGVNITYKILYNEAVAMTGGQRADGILPVPTLTRLLEAEGVKRTIVCTHDKSKYPKKAKWARNVQVWERDKLDEAQKILREVKGVTVLIYDQPCAADLRRKRKRGLATTPRQRVIINELVCEGCGDCGIKSNCLSVYPVETEFGVKTQIHQSSCNRDFTCLEGDCPAFVTIEGSEANLPEVPDSIYQLQLDEPDVRDEEGNIFMVGIGGTGVVTVNQILGTAAHIEGKYCQNLDQTGLSQKGGTVLSHVKIRRKKREISNRVPPNAADLYLVFDILGGVLPQNLELVSEERTTAVVSTSKIPTGRMVRNRGVAFPEIDLMMRELGDHVKQIRAVETQELSEYLFGTHLPANMILLGAAYQLGQIPLHQDSIFRAIEINGVAVDLNLKAFIVGRLTIQDPTGYLDSLLDPSKHEIPTRREIGQREKESIDKVAVTSELRHLLEVRVPELVEYQGWKLAEQYVDFLTKVREAEEKIGQGNYSLTESVARYLFKLMTYKDEYEVARLFLKPEFKSQVKSQFGENSKMYYHLHPPLLRGLGRKKKMRLGRWFELGFRILRKLRFVRGTALDIFGYTRVRRTERELIGEYIHAIEELLDNLTPETIDRAVQVAELPEMVRGYEEVKMRSIREYRERMKQLMSR